MNGEERKDAIFSYHNTANATAVLRGRRAFLAALLANGNATADDVYRAVELPYGVDPRCLGAVPKVFVSLGIIRAAGFVVSTRPERYGSIVRRWELIDKGGAERWLKEHPDPNAKTWDENDNARQQLPGVA